MAPWRQRRGHVGWDAVRLGMGVKISKS
jgi:hypothetical protein